MNADASIFYSTKLGRAFLSALLKCGMAKAMAAFLNSGLSKPMINSYIEKYGIDLKEYENAKYNNFGEFFIRKKLNLNFDSNGYISPCDGLLSIYTIDEQSSFDIKGSKYKISDLVKDKELAQIYQNGYCLIYRLTPKDYHRYIFSANGFVYSNNYIEGQLHSVQPIACEQYPVYKLNRRVWTKIETESHGTVTQIEVGAMAVGGIINHCENSKISRGEEMGYFSLCGSTIVQLIEPEKIKFLPKFLKIINTTDEIPIKIGERLDI